MSDDYLQKAREQFYRQVKNTKWDNDYSASSRPKKEKFVQTPIVSSKPIVKSTESPFEKKMKTNKFFKY
jgi:hypothetical protein